MAFSPNEKYPGAVAIDPNFKDGKFKDNSPSTVNNGSPLKALDRNERLSLDEAVMDAAGFEYNGIADTPQDSQLFKAYKAALGNGSNLLSNHNFLTPSPDDSQPAPDATPRSYPPGYQLWSGIFANDTTGITNLTFIDGKPSFTAGDFYFKVPNTGGLERVPAFTASVADYDGKPRLTGVSFALVGDEYVITVANTATDVFSVKFEQGGAATGHYVGANAQDQAHSGDSQVMGNNIHPINSLSSAEVYTGANATEGQCAPKTRYLRNAVTGKLFRTSKLVSGDITTLNMTAAPFTATVGGESVDLYISSVQVAALFKDLKAIDALPTELIRMDGYNELGDMNEHPGFTVFDDTTEYKDNFGGAIQLDNGNWAVVNNTKEVKGTWFGIKGNDESVDYSQRLLGLANFTRGSKAIFDWTGRCSTSPIEWPYNSVIEGTEAKNNGLFVYPLYPEPVTETYLFTDELNPLAPTRDNNFFVARSKFSVNANERKNIGAYNLRAGGASRYEQLYIVNGGEGAATLLMSGPGASVTVTLASCWIGTTTITPGAGPQTVHNRNGIECKASYSIVFENATLDYLSGDNTVINGVVVPNENTNITSGFSLITDGVLGLTFTGGGGEGNKKPFLLDNAAATSITGASFYRDSLAQPPSNDPDFVITVVEGTYVASPSIDKTYFIGYKESEGGGVLRTTTGTVLDVPRKNEQVVGFFSGGAASMFGMQRLRFDTDRPKIEAEPEAEKYTPMIGELAASFEIPANDPSGTFVVPLNGVGLISVVYRRTTDFAGYGQSWILNYIGNFDSGVLTTIDNSFSSVTYEKITSVDSSVSGGLRQIEISYDTATWGAKVEVYFTGSRRTS